MNGFLNSEHYLALKISGSENVFPFSSPITTLEARQMLFDEKLASYIVGRDSKVVYSSADLFSLNAVLPFSATNMILYFRNLEMNFADTLHPKRYIYKYLNEIIGDKAYNKLYMKQPQNKNNMMKLAQWENYIINNTNFGYQLTSELSDKGYYDKSNNCLQQLLSQYWYLTVKKIISEQKTEILEEN